MLDRVLEDKVLLGVVIRLGQLRVDGEELGVRASLNASVISLASSPLASGLGELARSAISLLPGRVVPARVPLV